MTKVLFISYILTGEGGNVEYYQARTIIILTNDVWEERTDCFQTPLTDVSVLTFLQSHLLNCPNTNDDARNSLRNCFILSQI